MQEGILLCLFHLIKKRRQKHARKRAIFKNIRDSSDPFQLHEKLFIENFRLSKDLCRKLIEELEPHAIQNSTIPFRLRFLCALNFYAHGSYQRGVGNNNAVSMSQSSVSRSMDYISKLIIEFMKSNIKFPTTVLELKSIKAGFSNLAGIEGTIGAIGCTHVAIRSPPSNDLFTPQNMFLNDKGYYSLNVEAVCDHKLRFTAINASSPGSYEDSVIWKKSEVRAHLQSVHNEQEETWLVGDSPYPLEPWLLTPITDAISPSEKKFNHIHVKARSTIQRAFCLLKTKFKCLSTKERVLHYRPEKAANIFHACAILHNELIDAQHKTGCFKTRSQNNDTMSETDLNSQLHKVGEALRAKYVSTLSKIP